MDHGRRRSTRAVAAAGVALLTLLALLLAGCGNDASPSTSFAPRPETGLAAKLEPAPNVSGPGASAWARDYTPSTTQYLNEFYAKPSHARIRTELEQQGLREIVHTLWITDDRIQNDIVVLEFATSTGAEARAAATRTTNGENRQLESYRIDSPGDPTVYYSDRANREGFRQANSYAQIGPYVIEMFTFAPDDIPRQQIERWLRAQVQLLES